MERAMPPEDVATPTPSPQAPDRAPARMRAGAVLALGACALLIMGAALPWIGGKRTLYPSPFTQCEQHVALGPLNVFALLPPASGLLYGLLIVYLVPFALLVVLSANALPRRAGWLGAALTVGGGGAQGIGLLAIPFLLALPFLGGIYRAVVLPGGAIWEWVGLLLFLLALLIALVGAFALGRRRGRMYAFPVVLALVVGFLAVPALLLSYIEIHCGIGGFGLRARIEYIPGPGLWLTLAAYPVAFVACFLLRRPRRRALSPA